MDKFSSCILAQNNDPQEIQKANLDLLAKINSTIDSLNTDIGILNASIAATNKNISTLDIQNVKVTGAQTILGVKTFTDYGLTPMAVNTNGVFSSIETSLGSGIIENGLVNTIRYIKMSDGTLFQWGSQASPSFSSFVTNFFGTTSGNSYYGSITVTIPIAFYATDYRILATMANSQPYSIPSAGKAVGSFQVQGFTGSLTGGVFIVEWMAIGRWKE